MNPPVITLWSALQPAGATCIYFFATLKGSSVSQSTWSSHTGQLGRLDGKTEQ